MAEVRIKTTGTTLDGAEIQNASTEETLKSVLDQLKLFNKNQSDFIKYAKDTNTQKKKDTEKERTKTDSFYDRMKALLGGKSSGQAVGSDSVASSSFNIGAIIGELGTFGELLSTLFPELEIGLLVFAGFELVSTVMRGLVYTLGGLSAALFDMKTNVSDYTAVIANSFKDVPIIGTLFEIISDGLKILDGWNQTLYSLSNNGASFNNSLIQMRTAAAQVGLPLDKFAATINKNIDNLANLGSVTDGVSTFVNVAGIGFHKFGQRLEDMGISIEQYTDELPGILAIIAPAAIARGDSDTRLARSAFALTIEFDALTKLTGKSRESQAADLQKQEANAAFQIKLSSLSADQADSLQKAMAQVNATMGSTAASLFEMKILGITPLSRDMQLMQSTMPGLNAQFDKLADSVNQGTLTQNELNNSTAEAIASAILSGSSINNILNAAVSGIGGSAGEIAENFNQIFADKGKFLHNGIFDKQAYINELNSLKQTQDARDKIKQSLDKFDLNVRNAVEKFIVGVIIPLYQQLIPYFKKITDWLVANPLPIDKIVGYIVDAGNMLLEGITYVKDNWDQIKAVLIGIGIGLIAIATPFILGAAIFVSTIMSLIDVVKSVYDGLYAIGAAIFSVVDFIQKLVDHPADTLKSIGSATVDAFKGLFSDSSPASNGSVVQNFSKTAPTVSGKSISSLIPNQSQNTNNTPLATPIPASESMNDVLVNISNKLDNLVSNTQSSDLIALLTELNDTSEKLLRSSRAIEKSVN